MRNFILEIPVSYDSLSLFSNGLLWALLGIIVLLLVFIIVLADALKHVAGATRESQKEKNNSGKVLSVVGIIAFMSFSKTSNAESFFAVSNSSTGYAGLSSGLFFTLIAFIVFELVVVLALINYIKYLAKTNKPEIVIEKEEPGFLEKFNASVAIENEHEILFDHEYDGIRELDNDLPPWWKYGFYLTIVVAFIYLVHYHVTATGDLQIAEYNKTVLEAKMAKDAYEKDNANSVNESNVTQLTDQGELAKGAAIFQENCFACHGKFGEGGVGPNLTDNYWLHGGKISDVFSTIKYGWPDKGMKSWQADLSPIQIHEVASYVKTLHGTNPPNGKAPQGDLFQDLLIKNDSLKTDSTQVATTKADSAKVNN